MSRHGHLKTTKKLENPTLKFFAQSGYYLVVTLVLLGVFIQEVTGNVTKVTTNPISFNLKSPADEQCENNLGVTDIDQLSCGSNLTSPQIFNLHPDLYLKKTVSKSNPSKRKGESHDYH